MTGQAYLEEIRANLESGRHQHRMGQNLLRAFGYVRRRATALDEMNAALDELGLATNPPINADMPLKTPRIRFSLKPSGDTSPSESANATNAASEGLGGHPEAIEGDDRPLPEPSFSISELRTAKTHVECVAPSSPLKTAYTTMVLNKYSQLVVAGSPNPRQQDIKGTISFQSMAKALMNGNPKRVGDCIDSNVAFAGIHDDLKSVVNQLGEGDIVLVVGRDKRLQGIVTAWDLAEEFSSLVDPFKRIGEIEERLRMLIGNRISLEKVTQFFKEHGIEDDATISDLEELSLGELQLVLEFPEHWDMLDLAFDRAIFIASLTTVRNYRNRLMHFRDPLQPSEMEDLANFCDAVREIQL